MQTKKSSRVAMETVYDDALKETIQKVKIVPVIIAYTVGKKRKATIKQKPTKQYGV